MVTTTRCARADLPSNADELTYSWNSERIVENGPLATPTSLPWPAGQLALFPLRRRGRLAGTGLQAIGSLPGRVCAGRVSVSSSVLSFRFVKAPV